MPERLSERPNRLLTPEEISRRRLFCMAGYVSAVASALVIASGAAVATIAVREDSETLKSLIPPEIDASDENIQAVRNGGIAIGAAQGLLGLVLAAFSWRRFIRNPD